MQLCPLSRFHLNAQQPILPCGYQIIRRIGDKGRVPPQFSDDGSSKVFANTPDLHLIAF